MLTCSAFRAASLSFLLLIATTVGGQFYPAMRGMDYYAPKGGTDGQVVGKTGGVVGWVTPAAGGASYVAGPLGCITIDTGTNPDEIDIEPDCVPQLSGANPFTGNNTFSGQLMVPKATTLSSAECDNDTEKGRIGMDSDAAVGHQLKICSGAGGWVNASGL